MIFSCTVVVFLLTPRAHGAAEEIFIGTGDQNIFAAHFDIATGALTELHSAAAIPSPSFLSLSPDDRFLYSVSERQTPETSSVSAFRVSVDGALTFLDRQLTGGRGPCHVSVDPQDKWVFAANYSSGSMAEYPIEADGSLGPRKDFIQNEGSGPNRQRQEGPHAHCVVTDASDRHVFDCDLGIDKVLIYNFDPASGALRPGDPPYYAGVPGSGPRHLAFHPNGRFAYLINELNSTLIALAYDSATGRLTTIQSENLLPSDFKGHNGAAEVEVHPSGKWVYASNRGHDSIVVYACDSDTGRLSLLERHPSGGHTPRHYEIDSTGQYLLVANQDSSNIIVLRIDQETGLLHDTGQSLAVPHPMCVLCLPPK